MHNICLPPYSMSACARWHASTHSPFPTYTSRRNTHETLNRCMFILHNRQRHWHNRPCVCAIALRRFGYLLSAIFRTVMKSACVCVCVCRIRLLWHDRTSALGKTGKVLYQPYRPIKFGCHTAVPLPADQMYWNPLVAPSLGCRLLNVRPLLNTAHRCGQCAFSKCPWKPCEFNSDQNIHYICSRRIKKRPQLR